MTNPDGASGPQRVAAFLLSLKPDQASKVFSHLKEEVVTEVAQAMVDLAPELADPSKVRDLHRQLALQLNRPRGVVPCDTGELSALLTSTFGSERGNSVLEEIQGRRLQEKPFLDLESEPPSNLARVLKEESHAVAALVLAHVEPSLSAVVLESFDPDEALEVVRRMATITPPGFSVLRSIASNLKEKLGSITSDALSPDPTTRLRTIADLLNFSAPEMEKSVLEALQADDAEMAAALREFMFTWEDIGTIDKRSMQKILGSVDTKTLSMALKACSSSVEDNIMANLSSRVREMVSEERDMIGAVPMTDVLAAREEIMRSIRALIEAGEFRPSRSGEDLVS